MFVMECLALVPANDCKSGVMNVKSDDGMIVTKLNRNNAQLCITWTKKSQ